MRMINSGTTKFNVALGRGLRAFKPWNWVRVLVAVPLLLTAALWVMAPQLGQAQGTAPAWITGANDSVAVRIPQHPVASGLCARAGDLVSTSANVSGYPTATRARQLRDWFGPHLDYVILGPAGTGAPSEVRDLMGTSVHRHGPGS